MPHAAHVPVLTVALFALGLYLGGNQVWWRGRSTRTPLVLVKCVASQLLMWRVMTADGVPDPWLGYLVLIVLVSASQNLFVFARTDAADVDSLPA